MSFGVSTTVPGGERRIARGSLVGSATVLGLLLTGAVVALVSESDRFALRPPTSAELQAFAARLEASFAQGSTELLRSRMLGEPIAIWALRGRDSTPEQVLSAARVFEGGLGGYVARLEEQIGPHGRWTVTRTVSEPEATLWIRLSGRSLGYLELHLAKDQLGRVVVVDLISHMSGTSFGDSIRRERSKALAAAAHQLSGFLDQGRDRDALAFARGLPEPLAREPELLGMRARAAASVGGEELNAALRALEEALPEGDPRRVVLLSHYWRQGQTQQALALLEAVGRRVDQDKALEALRAQVLLDGARAARPAQAAPLLEDARQRAARAAESLPRDPYVQRVALAVALQRGAFADAMGPLERLVREGVPLADLKGIPGFDELTRSAPFQRFSEERGGE
ncbi:MAG: hypothetical protein AB7N76_19295 [Planctomycetota bacterium]